jgi:DNA-directed RNA polymerase subunit RPC12/RpoP
MTEMKKFLCSKCNKIIEVPYGIPKPEVCPHCGAPNIFIHRVDEGGRGFGAGRGRRCGIGMMRRGA